MAARDDMSAEERLIARCFRSARDASRRAWPCRRCRGADAAARLRSGADDRRRHRRRAFLSRRSAGDDRPQGAAHEPLRSRRQGRAAGRLSAFDRAAGRRSTRLGSRHSRRDWATMREHYQCPLLGGDTDRTPGPISVSIAAFGTVPQGKMVRRSTAKAGDRIVVTGTIGDAALGVLLRRDAAIWHSACGCPTRRATTAATLSHAAAAQRARRGGAAARLGRDGRVRRPCRRSRQARAAPRGVAAEVDVARVPLSDAARAALAADPALLETVLTGGDDYEILLTLPPERLDGIPRRGGRSRRRRRLKSAASLPGRAPASSATARRCVSRGRPSAISSSRCRSADQATEALAHDSAVLWPLGAAAAIMADPEGRHARYDGHRQAAAAHAASPSRAPAGTPIRATPRCTGTIRPSTICAGARARGCRISPSNIATAAPGKDDPGIKRNWAALDAVELVPRYGVMPSLPPCEVELFGRRYAAPIGVAPMGGPAVVWPGADIYLARAAQRARVPYTLGTVGCATIEKIAEIAPDVFWFQLYRAAKQRSRHRLRSRPPRRRPRAATRWC